MDETTFRYAQTKNSNTGGSDLWSNTLLLDHGGARTSVVAYRKIIFMYEICLLYDCYKLLFRENVEVFWESKKIFCKACVGCLFQFVHELLMTAC